MPVFIDGRAELYGEAFDMAYYRAMQLKDVNEFLDILKNWDIDAVLLTPLDAGGRPARSYRRLAARLCRRQRRAARPYRLDRSAMTRRNQSLDLLRGVAILLVVAGALLRQSPPASFPA